MTQAQAESVGHFSPLIFRENLHNFPEWTDIWLNGAESTVVLFVIIEKCKKYVIFKHVRGWGCIEVC